MTLIAGNPPLQETPPSGGVSYLLCSLIKNPEEEDPPRSTWYKFFEGGTLPPGSWLGNIANRNPPRGGFSAINLIQSRLIQMCGTWLVRDSLHAFMCPHRWDLNHSWLVASIRDSLHSFVTRCMHSCVLIYGTWLIRDSLHPFVTRCIHSWLVACIHVSSYPTRCRRCIGCLKLQVSFHKRATNYRALLPKMTTKTKASWASSPRGYRDSARLLGESWCQKKWGAIRGKKLPRNREIVVEWMVGCGCIGTVDSRRNFAQS